ncbi:PKD domain-containing protein [Solirubrobacter deserti]|uniref:PKD domain-containing protein n=1 Tax=Solirubrobacter deserti TaxID=2282478 RepID=A0ABT4RD87_9ACTN|nr:PKD domain-containing protein [Solirubrobacter deserti]MDA0136475.1 PKD domain-containing protein [Solirubrobacter deserti]
MLLCSPLVLAAPAAAAEVCVATTTPCPVHNAATLAAALDAAEALPGDDTVRVGPGTHTGPFSYGGGGALTLVGEGIGTTVLDSTTNQVLGGIGTAVTVRDLTVRASDAAASTGVNLAGGTLERVRVEGGQRAVLVAGGGTLSEVEIDTRAGTALRVNGGTPTIRRSRIVGGVYTADEDLTMVDTRVERDGIDGGGPSASVTLRNVLIAVDGPQEPGLRLGNGAIDADHVTVVHRGGAAPGTPGVHAAPGATITLESSIVSGFPVSLKREASNDPVGTTDLFVRRSSYAFDRVVDVPGTSGGVSELGPGNVDAESGFVGAGDFRLRGDAAQVDRGMLTGITALELGGFARTVDGDGDGEAHTDMGAFEYRRLAPVVTLQAPATALAGQPVALAATASDPDGDPLEYAWSFGATGATTTHAFAAGTQLVTVTVTDAGGRTATASAVVDVAAPAPVPTPLPDAGGTPTGPSGPPADTTKPALTKLKVAKRRFTPSTTKPARAAGGELRLTLSEPARVTLRLERKRGKRWVAAPGSRSLDLPAGTSAVRFRGGLGRRLTAGRYRLVATPVDAAGHRGATKRLDFTVVHPRA